MIDVFINYDQSIRLRGVTAADREKRVYKILKYKRFELPSAPKEGAHLDYPARLMTEPVTYRFVDEIHGIGIWREV